MSTLSMPPEDAELLRRLLPDQRVEMDCGHAGESHCLWIDDWCVQAHRPIHVALMTLAAATDEASPLPAHLEHG